MAVTWNLSVVAAAAAPTRSQQVAAAAAESALAFMQMLTKLASRSLLSLGGVGVGLFVGLGALPPMRSLKSCVTRFGSHWQRLDTGTLGWTELKAGWLDGGCSRLGSIPGVSLSVTLEQKVCPAPAPASGSLVI